MRSLQCLTPPDVGFGPGRFNHRVSMQATTPRKGHCDRHQNPRANNSTVPWLFGMLPIYNLQLLVEAYLRSTFLSKRDFRGTWVSLDFVSLGWKNEPG